MLNGGISLDSQAAWDAWPETLPLLVWHGAADPICDPVAAKRFGENAAAKDKQVEMFDVSPCCAPLGGAKSLDERSLQRGKC